MISVLTHAEPNVKSPPRPAPDVRLKNIVTSELHASGYRPLIFVECYVHEGLVILSGSVPSFYLKQIAQTVVMKIDGVNGIENELRVEN
jgi:osmotically-inducible protein OsmY